MDRTYRVSVMSAFLLVLILAISGGQTSGEPIENKGDSSASLRSRLSFFVGGDIMANLGGMPSFNLQTRLGMGYSVADWHLRLGIQSFDEKNTGVMSSDIYRRGLTSCHFSAARKLAYVQPLVFGGIGKGTFEIKTGGTRLFSNKTAWLAGVGVGYSILSLGIMYVGPEVTLSEEVRTSGPGTQIVIYQLHDSFVAMLGITLEFNLNGKWVKS